MGRSFRSGIKLTKEDINEAIMAKAIYKKQIRRYLGLGFLLSFIPGTESYLGRSILLSVITKVEAELTGEDRAFFGTPFYFLGSALHAIICNHSDIDFLRILFRKYSDFGGLNRLNPFLYLTQLIKQIIIISNKIFNESKNELLLVLKNCFLYLIVLPLCPVILIMAVIGFVSYLATELLLNSLNTLLIEPFKFLFEAVHQFVKTSDSEFSFKPTEDYIKINRLMDALSDKPDENRIHIAYQTKELTLIEGPEKLIKAIDHHQNSVFFKHYKSTDLFEKEDQTIANAYGQLENYKTFNFFTRDILPTELRQVITNFCLEG